LDEEDCETSYLIDRVSSNNPDKYFIGMTEHQIKYRNQKLTDVSPESGNG
jgi:hypothetical protein